MDAGDEASFTQPYSLFSGADDYTERRHSDQAEQEMIDLITLQRLLSLAADDTPPSKVRCTGAVCTRLNDYKQVITICGNPSLTSLFSGCWMLWVSLTPSVSASEAIDCRGRTQGGYGVSEHHLS